MDICGEDLGENHLCCQTRGHYERGIPHLRMIDGGMYWEVRNALEYVGRISDDPKVHEAVTKAIGDESWK